TKTKRLFMVLHSFFRMPLVNARTRPAARKAKVTSKKALDWNPAVKRVFPKMAPLPANSRKIASRIQNPQAMADSRKSSPYWAPISPLRDRWAARRPITKAITQVPLSKRVPKTAKDTRNTEEQSEPVAT